MNELITKWKNGETAIYRFTTKGDAITAKMIFENHCRDEIEDITILEQQPCEDCISREALDDAISDLTYWHFENDRLITGGGGIKSETVYKVDDVWRLTRVLPSVTPQPKTGHWIDTGSGQECSECGEIQYGYDNFRCFCTNCGAKMEVARND